MRTGPGWMRFSSARLRGRNPASCSDVQVGVHVRMRIRILTKDKLSSGFTRDKSRTVLVAGFVRVYLKIKVQSILKNPDMDLDPLVAILILTSIFIA